MFAIQPDLEIPTQHEPRDRALIYLRDSGHFEGRELETYQKWCIISEYYSRPNHTGGVLSLTVDPESLKLRNGKLVRWKDVPLKRVIDDAEGMIKKSVHYTKKTEVWVGLLEAVGVPRREASWEKEPHQPHKHPATPHSASRAESPVSNQALLDRLSGAAGLDERKIRMVAGIATLNDSYNGTLTLGPNPVVHGGRLGRDHTLADVPHHYLRDQVMMYINDSVPVETKDYVRAAVFDDLSAEEVKAYAEGLQAAREAEEKADQIRAHQPSLKNRGEAKNLIKLEAALDAIDCYVDQTPNPDGFISHRDWERTAPMFGSCVHPNQQPTEAEERLSLADYSSIDKNCDQVRAMIALLIRYGDGLWTVDSFRKALGRVERTKLNDFLQRRGPRAGANLGLFDLCWEFFRKRELLGIALPTPPSTVRELANEHKRKREPLEERAANVIEKTAKERQHVAKARKIAADSDDGMIDNEAFREALAKEQD